MQRTKQQRDAHHEKLSTFVAGQVVETHPATDAWMRGVRYVTVKFIGREYVHVEDNDGRTYKFNPDNLVPFYFEGPQENTNGS